MTLEVVGKLGGDQTTGAERSLVTVGRSRTVANGFPPLWKRGKGEGWALVWVTGGSDHVDHVVVWLTRGKQAEVLRCRLTAAPVEKTKDQFHKADTITHRHYTRIYMHAEGLTQWRMHGRGKVWESQRAAASSQDSGIWTFWKFKSVSQLTTFS